jgi:host factor-I protein
MAFRSPKTDLNSHKGRTPPLEDTREEAAYLELLGEEQRPVRIKMLDGEVVRGWIEYYDRRMVRLTRDGESNLFIFKHDIAYIAEDGAVRKTRPDSPGRNGNVAGAAE